MILSVTTQEKNMIPRSFQDYCHDFSCHDFSCQYFLCYALHLNKQCVFEAIFFCLIYMFIFLRHLNLNTNVILEMPMKVAFIMNLCLFMLS